MEDAWEVAKKMADNLNVGGMSTEDLERIFGSCWLSFIFTNFSAKEAKEKVDAYYEEQKTLRVGDEVRYKSDENLNRGVIVSSYVTNNTTNNTTHFRILFGNGDFGTYSEETTIHGFVKTGRHFDEVDELLKKLK